MKRLLDKVQVFLGKIIGIDVAEGDWRTDEEGYIGPDLDTYLALQCDVEPKKHEPL